MRPTVEDTTDPYNCIQALPAVEEFPLWRIGCRVRLSLKIEERICSSLLGGP
jgi:hypothetical protein